MGIGVSLLLVFLLLWTFFNVIKPLNIIITVPIFLAIISVFSVSIYVIYAGIFDLFYSRTHCPFCKNPIKIADHMVLKCKKCGRDVKFADEYSFSPKNRLNKIINIFRKKKKK